MRNVNVVVAATQAPTRVTALVVAIVPAIEGLWLDDKVGITVGTPPAPASTAWLKVTTTV